MSNISVPAIMYHSIGVRDNLWNFSFLTCPYKLFEHQLHWLKVRGFKSITLFELFEYMKYNKKIPQKSIVLTFDDGYADNWVFAYPILKKYGYNATIYVNPEFVDPQNQPRKNLDDYWSGNASFNDLCGSGYLSWEEMKLMEEEGFIDIQSHTMSHTWLPRSDRIVDFRNPHDPYTWITWNHNIDKKPYLQKDDEKLKLYGQPVFEHDRAIGVKQFIPKKGYDHFFIDHVKEKGDNEFFALKNWREELFKLYQMSIKENPISGRYETDEEYRVRLYYELEESKKIIEQKLDKEIQFLCWPGGTTTPEANEIAKNIGYLSSNVTKDMQKEKINLKNRYGENPEKISRFGPSLYWDGAAEQGSRIEYKNGYLLLLEIERFRRRKNLAFILNYIINGISLGYKWKYKLKDHVRLVNERK